MAMEKGGGWWNEMEEDGKKPPWRSGTRRWVACGEGERTLSIDESWFEQSTGAERGPLLFYSRHIYFPSKSQSPSVFCLVTGTLA